jgi:hypothetical protein
MKKISPMLTDRAKEGRITIRMLYSDTNPFLLTPKDLLT